MHAEQRAVVDVPLREVWDRAGPLRAARRPDLSTEDRRDLLPTGPVRSIVADVGLRLCWLDLAECFAFWKTELRDHLCAGAAFFLDDYPGAYGVTASEWRLLNGERVVLLDAYH